MHINHFLFWLPMVALAFANATLRQLVMVKFMNELSAHQLSTITLIILTTLYVAYIFPHLHVQNTRQAIFIGLIWVALTVLFEFSLGRMTNKSWAYLLQDYNITEGHIWLIFLVSLFSLPWIFYMIKK